MALVKDTGPENGTFKDKGYTDTAEGGVRLFDCCKLVIAVLVPAL